MQTARLVMRLAEVNRCRRLPRNRLGRDFVVGDLHGQRPLLEARLAAVGFDPRIDRVFSVGDLIDRGPDSLETLALIEEPWFHAVLGNHELMLLHFLGMFEHRELRRRDFAARKGPWVLDALYAQRGRLLRLAEQVATLPLALHVDDDAPFNVMHGDLHPLGSCQSALFREATIDVLDAWALSTSRGHRAELRKARLEVRTFAGQTVHLSATPSGRLPWTYVGHSPMAELTVHRSYCFVDQGVRSPGRAGSAAARLTLLDHGGFARWLERTLGPAGPASLRPATGAETGLGFGARAAQDLRVQAERPRPQARGDRRPATQDG